MRTIALLPSFYSPTVLPKLVRYATMTKKIDHLHIIAMQSFSALRSPKTEMTVRAVTISNCFSSCVSL